MQYVPQWFSKMIGNNYIVIELLRENNFAVFSVCLPHAAVLCRYKENVPQSFYIMMENTQTLNTFNICHLGFKANMGMRRRPHEEIILINPLPYMEINDDNLYLLGDKFNSFKCCVRVV